MVIRAAGDRAFCAGADVADHLPETAPRMLEAFHAVARLLWTMEPVSVAAVKGPALGGGMELALCCDLVVASERAEFGQPEIRVGCFPPIAAALLPERVGPHRAADLVLTGRRIDALEAERFGIVSRVAAPDRFDAVLRETVEALRGASGPVLARAIRALRGTRAASWSDALSAAEKIYIEELLPLPDAREGVEAFLQKREPRWTTRNEETLDR